MNALKIGDKIELRDDLKVGEFYGELSYRAGMPAYGIVYFLDMYHCTLKMTESFFWFPVEMVGRVNNRKVEFVSGFEYIIMEDERMDVNPKNLVQSGDFVVYEWEGNECISVAIQRGDKLILVDDPRGFIALNDARIMSTNIKKIFRYNSDYYRIEKGFKGNFEKDCGKFIYDSEKEAKEMTMEEINKVLGYKVKIVEGK